jgi:hypothetical protein
MSLRVQHRSRQNPQQAANVAPIDATFVDADIRHLAHSRSGGNVIE